MSKKIKDEQKKFLGETLNQYDKALNEGINQLDKKNREQNHKISSLVNSFDNEYLEKDVEGNITTLENSKNGMVIIDEIQGNTEVNYCKDGEKELILNGDIDTQGESFVTITESVDGGLVDVSLEGNTEINLSKTKDPVLVTREFDDINCNAGKLQYTIDDVTTINDEPGKVDIDRIVGDTMVNHAVNGSEELILNAHINESGDNSITLNGVTSDGGLVDVALEGNTLVNVSKTKDSTVISKAYTVENSGNHIALQGDIDGSCRPVITGNTLVNCLRLNNTNDFYSLAGKFENGYIVLTADGNYKNFTVKSDSIILKPSTVYSYIIDIIESNIISTQELPLRFGNTSTTDLTTPWVKNISVSTNVGRYIITNTTIDDFSNVIKGDRGFLGNTATSGTIKFRYMILEGDYTNKPIPDYFTGLQSSFEDNLVTQEMVDSGEEVADNLGKYRVDYKATGKNKCPNKFYSGWSNRLVTLGSDDNVVSELIKVKHNTQYTINNSDFTYLFKYDGDKKFIGSELIKQTFNTKDATYIRIAQSISSSDIHLENYNNTIQLEEGTEVTEYEPYKESTKTLYLNSPLLEGDTIEEKDGGIYHVHRYTKVVFDGSDDEYWEKEEARFSISISNVIPNRFSKAINNALFTTDSLVTDDQYDSYAIINGWGGVNKLYLRDINKFTTLAELKQWLQQNPLTVAYELAIPTYELIEQSNLAIPSYANGHLDLASAVPIEKVDFLPFTEELTYLYANTQYTVQFISDKAITVDITLGCTQLLAQPIAKGLNKISITTPSELVNNKLVISGVGANISEVVVTNTDREFGYFEGMKSVGECEELEVKSSNKNLFRNPNIQASNLKYLGNNEYICTNQWGIITKINVTPGEKYTFCYKIKSDEIITATGSSFVRLNNPNGTIVDNTALTETTTTDYIEYTSTFTPLYSYVEVCIRNSVVKTLYVKDIMIMKGEGKLYTPPKENTQQLTHEPLRAVGDAKDRYVLIDGKWYIERNCGEVVLNKDNCTLLGNGGVSSPKTQVYQHIPNNLGIVNSKNIISDIIPTHESAWWEDIECITLNADGYIQFRLLPNEFPTTSQRVIYKLATPTYEPIDYNPLEVYSDVTHITTNSTIPTNITVKNHGYNMVALKENTQYTLYVNKDTTNTLTYRLGDYIEVTAPSKFTFTTPATLTDKTLRIDGKGAKVKDLMLIEGTPTNDSIGYFDGLKSSYECEQVTDENDVNYGKYKVDIKVVGKNLISSVIPNRYQNYSTTNNNFSIVTNSKCSITNFIRVIPGKTYIGTGLNGGGAYYDSNKKPILPMNGNLRSPFTVPTGAYYLVANLWTNPTGEGNIQLEEGDTATEYEPYFESTQAIYLNSPLLKGDEIVWKDNKIQHYHKMNKVVLDGSDDEEIKRSSVANTDCVRYYIKAKDIKLTNTDNTNFINMYSDKFITNMSSEALHVKNIEGISSTWDNHITVSILMSKLSLQDVVGFRQWLQQNPIKVAYELETPYYEEISDYPLKLNVIANSSLSTESTIQVTNISFNIYEETLPYLYPNTKYYITFNSDVDRNNIVIDLGGNHVVFDCKVGFNKVEITTPSNTTNLLTFSGTGVNIDHVKVTQQDIDEYFEGMKNVGECEELEITSANSDNTLLNTQQLTHKPLRAVGEVKDRYVLIDNKWYIERRCGEIALESLQWEYNNTITNSGNTFAYTGGIANILVQRQVTKNYFLCNIVEATKVHNHEVDKEQITQFIHSSGIALRISRDKLQDNSVDSLNEYLSNNNAKLVYQLATPVYEEIDYNPFEVYPDVTHITTNSLIPTNVVVKNHGYNCILKPSTKYTVALNKPNGIISAKLGGSAKVDSTNSVFTITTPSTLNDNVLRLSGSGSAKDIMILEGDKTVNTPSYFEGIESVFEQEYDAKVGKYRVTARVEGNGKESSIIFYIDEPLRGTGIAKDKIFIQDGKVVVQRNCGSIILDGKAPNRGDDKRCYHIWTNSTGNTVNGYVFLNEVIEGLQEKIAPFSKIQCTILPSNRGGHIQREEGLELTSDYFGFSIHKSKLGVTDVNDLQNNELKVSEWFENNPVTVVYQLAEPVYEEADCDLSKLVLENYENSSLIFESNIPVSANIKYSGEVPVVTQAKSLSSQVDNTTLDINENIIPYMCDIDYRIVELQLMNGDTQGEGIELLGIGDIEILGNENVLFNNREDKKYNYSYDMLKRDILSQRYSKEEYQYRLDRYLLANKISDEEYKELEGLLHNGE